MGDHHSVVITLHTFDDTMDEQPFPHAGLNLEVEGLDAAAAAGLGRGHLLMSPNARPR